MNGPTWWVMPQTNIRLVRPPVWALVLIVSCVLALLLAVFVLAAGLFLIVFPVMLVAAAIAALLGVWRPRKGGGQRAGVGVIEVDYVVHEEPPPHGEDARPTSLPPDRQGSRRP